MRGILTSSGLCVALILLLLIHTSIIGNNIRENETQTSLNSSMDYAFDKMCMYFENTKLEDYLNTNVYVWLEDGKEIHNSLVSTDTYNSKTYDKMYNGKEYIKRNVMEIFCRALQSTIKSDGEIKVELMYFDLEKGTVQIRVTENYKGALNRQKECKFEKTYGMF